MTLAILSALADEQRGLLSHLTQTQQLTRAGRTVIRGKWGTQDVVLALTKVGKVAAATTTTALIEAFDVKKVLFTGVAGGIGPGVAVGDVVVAQSFIQHDMNAAPLFARFELPLYGLTTLACDPALSAMLLDASSNALAVAKGQFHPDFSFDNPRIHRGLVASGDQFVCSEAQAQQVLTALKNAGFDPLAVEMEGAAVAQVCHDYGVPFAAMRTISDRADDQAHADFSAFVTQVASPYAVAVVQAFMKSLSNK